MQLDSQLVFMLNTFSLSLPLPSACPASSLSPHVESIWALLFQNCECQEEGTRNLVAECLGKLTFVNASQLLPRLKQQLKAGTVCEGGYQYLHDDDSCKK